jgi:hypothetical protein
VAYKFEPEDDEDKPYFDDETEVLGDEFFDRELNFAYAHGMTILDHLDRIEDEDPDGEY